MRGTSSSAIVRAGARVALVLAVLGAYVLNAVLGGKPMGSSGDLGTFLVSGRAGASGLNPYDVAATPFGRGVNLNPPISLVAFEAASRVDAGVLTWVWWGASLAAIAASLVLLRRAYPQHLTSTPWLKQVCI